MIISMPKKDGNHVLIRETVDGVPQYSWTGTLCLVKVNNASLFEYTAPFTEKFYNQWKFELHPGLYLVNTSITCYIASDSLFNECDSIESVVGKGYKVSISMDGLSLLDVPFIDTLNNLVSISDIKLINGIWWTSKSYSIPATTNIQALVCLGDVKSITIVFKHLGEWNSPGAARSASLYFGGSFFFFWLLVMGRYDLADSLNALGSLWLLVRVIGGVGCGLHLLARSSQSSHFCLPLFPYFTSYINGIMWLSISTTSYKLFDHLLVNDRFSRMRGLRVTRT